MSLSERIKKARKNLKLSQQELADRLHVHQGHISKIEKGKATPSLQLINSICRELNIKEEWLLFGETLLKESKEFTTFFTRDEIENFIDETKDISKKGLYNTLKAYDEFITQLSENLFQYTFAYKEIGKPDEKITEAIHELKVSMKEMIIQLDDLFRRLENQEPPEMLKNLEELEKEK